METDCLESQSKAGLVEPQWNNRLGRGTCPRCLSSTDHACASYADRRQGQAAGASAPSRSVIVFSHADKLEKTPSSESFVLFCHCVLLVVCRWKAHAQRTSVPDRGHPNVAGVRTPKLRSRVSYTTAILSVQGLAVKRQTGCASDFRHTHLVRAGSVMVKPTNEWLGRAIPTS